MSVNNKLNSMILKSSLNYNLKLKKFNKIKSIENEEKTKFLENLENLKNIFKLKIREDFDNWGSYKKKYQFTKKVKEVKKEFIINLNILNIKKILHNSSLYINIIKNLEKIKNKTNSFKIIIKVLQIGVSKINITRRRRKWLINKPLFIIVDVRTMRTKIILFNKTNCISTMTNGLVFKKLELKNKKYRKSEKLSFLCVKMLFNKTGSIKNKNIFIQVKGLKKVNSGLLRYFNKSIDNNNNNIMYINNFKISNNKYFKFKKVKSIKRRLKKKIIKLK